MNQKAEIHFFCGKMAAGKSTLASEMSQNDNTVLLVEDKWLSNLYPIEITDIASYIKYSTRLQELLSEHINSLLSAGVTVVLDFPGNTEKQRNWFQDIIKHNNIPHTLHYVVASDELCKKQLKERSQNKPEGAAFTTEKEFDEITKYFQEPGESEGLNILRYDRNKI